MPKKNGAYLAWCEGQGFSILGATHIDAENEQEAAVKWAVISDNGRGGAYIAAGAVPVVSVLREGSTMAPARFTVHAELNYVASEVKSCIQNLL